MSDSLQASQSEPDILDRGTRLREVSDAFVEQLRSGDCPSIEEYKLRHPDLAAELSELLPVLEVLEGVQPDEPVHKQSDAGDDESISEEFGEYRIIQEIGRGGMGIVYEAEHETMCRRVALKILPRSTAAESQQLARFHREARAAGQLHHTNIVPVFEVGECKGMHYYAMQFIRGQNLDVVLNDLRAMRGEPPMTTAKPLAAAGSTESERVNLVTAPGSATEAYQPAGLAAGSTESECTAATGRGSVTETTHTLASIKWTDAVTSHHFYCRVGEIGIQIADALDYAHVNGLLHRDIKPSNLILDAEGTVWITDFGLAKHEDDELTQTGDVVGTLRYMAPERFEGSEDARSDIYGLGLTLYELCTFRHAHASRDRAQLVQQVTQQDPTPPRRIDPRIPRDLETIILKAIDRHPERRYQSARQVADDLRLFLSDRPIRARRVSFLERLWRICRRNPGTALTATCLALALAFIAIGSAWFAILSGRQTADMQWETRRARIAERRAVEASRESRLSVYQLSVGQAEMHRRSRRPGQHYQALESIGRAVRLLPELDFEPDRSSVETVRLRSEAVGAMAVADVREVWTSQLEAPASELICFDERHQLYAYVDEVGQVRIRSVDESRPEIRIIEPRERASHVQLSGDGRYLLAVFDQAEDSFARVWDLASPEAPLLEIDDRLGHVGADFAHGPDLFAITRAGRQIDVYSLQDTSILTTLPIGCEGGHIQFSSDGTKLAVGEHDGSRIEIWSSSTEPLRLESREIDGMITSLAWHSERSILAVGTRTGEIHVWRGALASEPRRYNPHRNRISRLFIDRSGDLLFSDSWDRTSRLTDLAAEFEQLVIESHDVLTPGFSTDGSTCAFRRPSGEFGLWQLPKRALTVLGSTVDGGNRGPRVRFHPQHQRLAARSTNRQIEFWDVRRPIQLLAIPLSDSPWIRFTPDGSALLTSGATGLQRWPVQIVESASGIAVTLSAPVTLIDDPTDDFDLTRSGQAIAVILPGYRSQLVDAETGRVITQFGRHHKANRILTTPDERWVLTSTWDGNGVFVWDAHSGEPARELEPGWFTAQVTINPRTQEAFISRSEESRFWSLTTWDSRPSQSNCRERLARFSPSGQLLAMGFSAYTPQLADPDSASMLTRLESPSPIASGDYEFSPDESLLAIASDGLPQIWDLNMLRRGLRELDLDWQSTTDSIETSEGTQSD